jgi:alpha-L-fucosidase 2
MLLLTTFCLGEEPSSDAMRMRLDAPITTWDEAIPLGNGLLGGLLWGEAGTIRLSLDRGDLWDERPADGMPWDQFNYANLQRLIEEGDQAEIVRVFDYNYDVGNHPTKIPAGRLELTLPEGVEAEWFELDMTAAQGLVGLNNGAQLEAFYSAVAPVALMKIPTTEPIELKLKPPESVKLLGYPDPVVGEADNVIWFTQEAADGLSYCVCVAMKKTDDATLLAATVTASEDVDGGDPASLAIERTTAALAEGYAAMQRPHADWWNEFWSQSNVDIPHTEILRHYNLVQYFYGAASRRGAPPMPLQGVWTADAGSLPPWKGDYHNDLNTQMTYMAYQASGRFDQGACFLDLMWDLLPTYREFAADFYDAPGAAVPGVMTLKGQPLGGWPQYSLSPVQGAWIAHLFYLHWRYTMDETFLRERAYPWCEEVAECIDALLEENADGILVLPLSASPEIHNNSLRAWMTPNTNYDITCLRMMFLGLAEMADACDDVDKSAYWKDRSELLGPYHVAENDTLKLTSDEDLLGSHRHLSNLMGLFPFNLTTSEGGPQDQAIIDASLQQWDELGTSSWCGYSFSWMACMHARVGKPESALSYLDIYERAFILRNGFHVNGDQLKAGYSNFQYRPFTLEGNFMASQAVHEMLLQSWSPALGVRDTERIRIFPAVPEDWADASFTDLRAEGGYRVSAQRKKGVTTSFSITASRDGVVRIVDNFGDQTMLWNLNGMTNVGDAYEIVMKAGDTISADLVP